MGDEVENDVCRDFLRNACNRGNKCRFAHPLHMNNSCNKNGIVDPQEERQKFSRTFCHDFQNAVCNRVGCKFIHCSKDDQTNFCETGTLSTYILEDAILKSVIPSLPGEPPVCRDYLNGECRRGKTCKFRHLSHCKYRRELDVLFGVVETSTIPQFSEPKRFKTTCSPCNSYFSATPSQPFSQCFPMDKCKLHYYGGEHCVAVSTPIQTACHVNYNTESCCEPPQHVCTEQDRSFSLQEENAVLKKQIHNLKKQLSDLTAANEFLLDQNASLRLSRKNGNVMTLQPPPPGTIMTGTPVNVQPAPGQLVAVSGQSAPAQQIVAAAVPVSIAPVTGPGPGQMTLSTVAVAGGGNTQQLVPVSCHAAGQQIMAAVSTVTVAGQTGASPALLATAVPVSQQQLVPVSVSAVPVSLATVSMAPMHMPSIVTPTSDPPHSIAMSVSAGTSLVSYPIMTQPLLQTR